MQTSDLVEGIAEKTGMSKIKIKAVLHEMVNQIHDAVARGEDVAVAGLFRLYSRKAAPRNGVNPRTMEKIVVPERIRLTYLAPKSLKASAQKQLEQQ